MWTSRVRPRRSGLLRKNSGKTKILSHIHTLCGNQAAGKAEEDEEAEEVAVSNFVPISLYLSLSLPLSISLSLAAAHGVSGQHFQALTRWLPDFQSQAPAGIMRRQRVREGTPAVQTIIFIRGSNVLSIRESADNVQNGILYLQFNNNCVAVCIHQGYCSVNSFLSRYCRESSCRQNPALEANR